MVLCIVALIVFAVLGIFSVRYRRLAEDAFGCVTRMVTLRPCDTKLDERIRAKILAKTLKFSPSLAGALNKHFHGLSWIFTALFFASLLYTAYGAYNLFTIGTCDPADPASCIFTPFLTNQTQTNQTLPDGKLPCGLTGFVEFYGAECPHCKKMMPIVEHVENETGVAFQKLEVWHNETNVGIMALHAEDITRDCGNMFVPAFLSLKTNKSVCGEMSADKLKRFILENG
jgi:thiol-disulfide isomerase/thioredoxin